MIYRVLRTRFMDGILDHHRMLTMNRRIDIDAEYGCICLAKSIFDKSQISIIIEKITDIKFLPVLLSAYNTRMSYHSPLILLYTLNIHKKYNKDKTGYHDFLNNLTTTLTVDRNTNQFFIDISSYMYKFTAYFTIISHLANQL